MLLSFTIVRFSNNIVVKHFYIAQYREQQCEAGYLCGNLKKKLNRKFKTYLQNKTFYNDSSLLLEMGT